VKNIMKAWKKAAILSLVAAGILVPASIVMLKPQGKTTPDSTTGLIETSPLGPAELNAFYIYGNRYCGIWEFVADTPVSLALVQEERAFGITPDGYEVPVDSPAAYMIVHQCLVECGGFQGGTVVRLTTGVISSHFGAFFYENLGCDMYRALIVDRFIA